MNEAWVIIAGLLVAIPCAILGCFLVLRKMVMVGDAISHAVLPGIVVAFMITRSFDSVYMIIGAAALGMFTTFLIEFFHRVGKVQNDASIGVTFTWLFAVGVILISVFLSGTDLDQDCVLYGEILTIPYNKWITASGMNLGPIAVWILGALNIIIISYVIIGFRGLMLTSFDVSFAAVIGINTILWHYSLMGAVSLVTVASFEAVGAILVIAFLVAPAASAYLLTTNLKPMIFLAVLFAIISVIVGYFASKWINGSTSSAIATCSGVIFAIALVIHLLLAKRNAKATV